MAIFDDGIKAFLEAYTYFSKMLGKGMEKTAKKFAEEATGVKAPEKLEPVIPGNEVINLPNKTEKRVLMSINSTFSNPLKSDLVLSKIDGTASSKYTALRSETELMFPKFTQDLQYIKDNNIALTTVQKNNILNNLRLKRSLESDIKKLETNLVADKKNPQMIYEAYKQSVGKPIKQTKEESLAEGRKMFEGFEPKVIEGGKGVIPKDKMTKTMIDEGFADPKYFDPNALDISSNKPVTMNKAFFDNAREQAIKQINEQERLMVPKNHSNYKYLMASLRGNKDKLTALNITEELGGNIKMFDDLRMKNITDMNAAPLNKFEYLKNPSVDDGTKGIPKKAGQGKFTKAQVLIARLENTLKTSKDPYVQENFPNFIKEIKAQPELANNKNVFDTLGGPLPKNQKFVEYDDGTMDFFQKTDFGPQNIAPAKKLAEELGISTKEASAILKMEPEDQVLEIGKRKALADKIDNLVDDTLSEERTSLYDENFDDYFNPDDKPKHAKGGIVSLV